MKKLKVTNHHSPTGISYALVDNEDFERLSKYTWGVGGKKTTLHIMRKRRKGETTQPNMTQVHLSREIIDCPKGMFVDHIDRNPFNNQKTNLRICTLAENSRNRIKNLNKCSSKHKGVHWFKRAKLWQTYINFNNKRISLGYFKDEKQAALAYNHKASELFGEFALLNKI